ncbi:ABC transporter substrate-binding protein [Phytoactinopolyspora halotolerans]|uniref:Sugar ABC transporter substrate-binding protein n=1 Tax=Phytoactinopolyspora halotolerans TaxID=1981512 RepID=A0A6L9S7T2_9ACTN|nr:sugar ABC transporter substrate-binding protein [Phytoactinopolyspora halotolerans]NEE00704.1 sugar ABC transporter substrate-binding protein [Phytoactinopolyspora halotolerans]
MSPRTKVIAGAVMAGTLALPACGNPSDATSGGGESITVVMSNHPFQRGIEPLIPDFEEETGIEVNVETFAEQQARDKIQLNLQSKSAAMDVYMTLPSREGPLFADAGYYEPLDDYLADASEDYRPDDFSRGAIDGMKVDEATYAVPINVEGPVLYYRTDLFEEWGLTPPATVEELIDTAAAIAAEDPGITPITLRGQAPALPFTFGPFVHGNGVEWTDDEGRPNFDEPGAVEAIEAYATLAREYGPPGVINYSFTESSTLFAQGEAAMMLESSNELNSVVDQASSTVGETVGVAPVPGGSAGAAPTVLSWGLAMSPHSQNKDDAWRFLEWASSPETQLALTEAEIAPPRASVAQDSEYTDALDTPTLQAWHDAVVDLQENGHVEVGPVGTEAPTMRQVIGDAVGKAILGDATAEEAAAEIQAGLEPLLAER